MTAEEFRAKRYTKVALPKGLDNLEFEIRKISVMEVLECGGTPDLRHLIGKPQHEVLKALLTDVEKILSAIFKDIKAGRKTLEKICMFGITSPEFSYDKKNKDAIYIGDLTHVDLDKLSGAILQWSGFNKEAAESIGPLSETPEPSSISIQSADDMEGSPQKSPAQATPSQPTP